MMMAYASERVLRTTGKQHLTDSKHAHSLARINRFKDLASWFGIHLVVRGNIVAMLMRGAYHLCS